MFETLYKNSDYEIQDFGDKWCAPAKLSHAEDTLIAEYPKSPPDGDGQSVKVYCSAWPARFYTLVVASEPDSIDEMQDGYEVSTGSGQHKVAAQLAKLISEGMLCFTPANSTCTKTGLSPVGKLRDFVKRLFRKGSSL